MSKYLVVSIHKDVLAVFEQFREDEADSWNDLFKRALDYIGDYFKLTDWIRKSMVMIEGEDKQQLKREFLLALQGLV